MRVAVARLLGGAARGIAFHGENLGAFGAALPKQSASLPGRGRNLRVAVLRARSFALTDAGALLGLEDHAVRQGLAAYRGRPAGQWSK